MPMLGLLAAVVHAQGGTIVKLGLLGAASGLGALIGALIAGWRGEGTQPVRLYALLGLVAAAFLAAFAWLPVSYLSALPLALVGGALFSQAVWNTSRGRLVADAIYQARLAGADHHDLHPGRGRRVRRGAAWPSTVLGCPACWSRRGPSGLYFAVRPAAADACAGRPGTHSRWKRGGRISPAAASR